MRQLARIADLTEEDWKHLRRRGIGGSDAATLLGHNPWRDAFCVYVDKVCDELAPDIQRESAYWGIKLEPLVAGEFQFRHPDLLVHKPRSIIGSSEYSWALGSLDYLVSPAQLDPEPGGVLEIKTTSSFYGKVWDAGIPPYAYTQLQHYLMVTGLSSGWVACLIGGQRYIEYSCERDEQVIAQIIQAGEDLMRRVEERDPPEPDPSKPDVLEALERLQRNQPARPKHPATLILPGWGV